MPIKKIFFGLLSAILFLLVILFFNWMSLSKFQPDVEPVESIFDEDKQISETLSQLIKFKTISHIDASKSDSAVFAELLAYLKQRFPTVHEKLRSEKIGDKAILYTWQGSSTSLKPIMLVAHYDVVPNESGEWQHEAFSGHIDDEFVWGRGAMDDKSAIVAIFHAIEKLIESDFSPQRSIILAFGGDEEIGGVSGAKKVTEHLLLKNVTPEFIHDEGMPITDGIMKGVNKPVAMIGIAEKGFVNVKLIATATEGHSSAPPQKTAVGILANAISKLEAAPMKASITKPIALLFDTLAKDMALPLGVVVSNRWLFESILTGQLEKQNSTNALIRTTMATTMIQGSQQANVLPKTANAVINVRILPGDSVDKVITYIKKIIGDEAVNVSILGGSGEPSSVSSIATVGYKAIANSISQIYPDILVAPSLLIAGTDSKHYKQLTENIYRFRPLWIKKEDISRFHGSNERIGIENLQQMTMFYYQLITNASAIQVD